MPDKPAVLYHGSPLRLDRLDPLPARGAGPETDTLTAVYATDRRNLAIAFALQPASGVFGWSLEMRPDGTPSIRYHGGGPNAGGVGYLHILPSDTFAQVTEDQWVSYVPVVPVAVEVIRVADYLHWVEAEN